MATYRVGPLEADTDQFQMRIEGRVVEVKPKAFDACVLFCRHPDRVLTKRELIDSLWPETIVTESSLFKVVQELRRALQDAGCSGVTIENVPGRGYRLSWDETGGSNPTAADAPRRPGAAWLLAALAGLTMAAFALLWNRADVGMPAPDARPPIMATAPTTVDPAELERLVDQAPEQALQALAVAGPALDPAWASLQGGRALLRLGRVDEAIAALDAAWADPSLDEARSLEALRALSRALDHAGRAPELFERVESRYPDPALRPPVVLLLLGNAAQERGDFEQARTWFAQVLVGAEADGDAALQQHALGSLGTLAARRGDSEEARHHYRRALDLALDRLDLPMAAALQTNLGALAQRDGELDTAARAYAEAYRILENSGDGPTLAMILLNFANVQLDAGRLAEASAEYLRLIDWAEPRGQHAVIWMTRLNLVLLRLRQGDTATAAAEAERLLAGLGTDGPPDLRVLGHALQARALAEADQPLRALEQIAKMAAVELPTPSADAEFQAALARGLAEARLERPERALAALDQGLTYTEAAPLPDHVAFLQLRARNLAALGRAEAAEQDRQRVAELHALIEQRAREFGFRPEHPLALPD